MEGNFGRPHENFRSLSACMSYEQVIFFGVSIKIDREGFGLVLIYRRCWGINEGVRSNRHYTMLPHMTIVSGIIMFHTYTHNEREKMKR